MKAPSNLPILFRVAQKIQTKREKTASTQISTKFCILKAMGVITEPIPRMVRMLKTFDPTTLPTAISSSFLRAATREVTSSGREVPVATMVRPIRVSVTPSIVAINEAIELSKKYSEEAVTKMINGILDKIYHEEEK